MNEASGTTMADSSANGQTGTYAAANLTYNQATLVADGSGNGSMLFSGGSATNLGTVANSATISPTSFTFTMWFKFTGAVSNACALSMGGEVATASGWEILRLTTTSQGFSDFATGSSGGQNSSTLATVFDGSKHLYAVGVNNNVAYYSQDGGPWVSFVPSGTYGTPANNNILTFGEDTNQTTLVANGNYQMAAMFAGQLPRQVLQALNSCGTGGSCSVNTPPVAP